MSNSCFLLQRYSQNNLFEIWKTIRSCQTYLDIKSLFQTFYSIKIQHLGNISAHFMSAVCASPFVPQIENAQVCKFCTCLHQSVQVVHLSSPQHYLCMELDMLSKQESIKRSLLPVTHQASSIESICWASVILRSAKDFWLWTQWQQMYCRGTRKLHRGEDTHLKVRPGGEVTLADLVIS